MIKIKRLDTVLGQVLPCQSDPISIVFITRGIIFIFGNCNPVILVMKVLKLIKFELDMGNIHKDNIASIQNM